MLPEDDVRIYHTEDDSSTPPTGEGERSAALYLHHKETGNLQKCRELGALLGTTFVDEATHINGQPNATQVQVLLSFVLSDELEGIIFDQLLQKSALSSFNQTVEQLCPELARSISDSTAYTLYILNDRNALGETFAELCGSASDNTLIDCGNALADKYRQLYANIISSYCFIPANE